jgi:hypothetical protein
MSGFDKNLVWDKSFLCNVYRNSTGRGTLSRRHGKVPGERRDVTVITVARFGF